MKRFLFSAVLMITMAAPSFAQGDLNSQLANYYSYQNEGNDTAAFNLIKNVYFSIRESGERDQTLLDKYITIIDSYMGFFTACTPEEEDEKGLNTCARLEFQFNQVQTVILPEVYSFRAEAKISSSDYLGALEDYGLAIKARPDIASFYTNRGNVRYKMKDMEGAIEDFDKSLGIDSSNASVYFNKGIVQLRTKDYAGALQAFHNCTEIEPGNTRALYYKGLAQYQSDLGEDALATFAAVNAADPTNDDAYFYSGLIHYKAKAFDLARDNFGSATQANPKNEKAWYYFGISAFNLQDKATACDAWAKAKELGYDKADKMITDYCGE